MVEQPQIHLVRHSVHGVLRSSPSSPCTQHSRLSSRDSLFGAEGLLNPTAAQATQLSGSEHACTATVGQRPRTHATPDHFTDTSVEQRDQQLAQIAYEAWAELPSADVVAAVDAANLASAQDGSRHSTVDIGAETAAATAQTAAHVQRQGLATSSTAPADWTGFGQVIPVLAASPGCGASLVATVLADAMHTAGRRVLLVDTADPARSGLTAAARSDGPVLEGPHRSVRIRMSWRAQAVLARVESELPVITPGMVPPPRFFKPAARSVQATVVDLGHDPWRVAAHPLAGAGAWLRAGTPIPRPVLVCRASRPSLLHAEQVLARLEAWNNTITPPVQLVVVGATRWPAGVPGCAGRRVSALLDDALFLPHDPGVATSGITAEATPQRLRDALAPVLRRWELLPAPAPANGCMGRLARRVRGADA